MLPRWTRPRRRSPSSDGSASAWAFVAAGAVALLGYAVGPAGGQLPLFLAVAVGSIAATVVGTLRHRGRRLRRPWWAIVAAVCCFFAATILRIVVPGADPAAPPSLASLVPDILVVPGYLSLGYGLMAMLGQRRAGDDDPARADAVLVGLGAALALWVFLVAPQFGGRMPAAPVLAAATFPMVDVILLVLVIRLLVADGVRQVSLWLFATATVAMFAGDLLYSVEVDWWSRGGHTLLIDVAFITAYITIGAAVLHPTMRTLMQPQRVVVRTLGPGRVASLAVLLLAPTVLDTLRPAPAAWDRLVRLGCAALIIVTVVMRVVSSHNSRSRAEQVARNAARAARHRATHDSLTELPNRELLADTITAWSAPGAACRHEISVLFLDLDRFKAVNDRWGHAVGDELLCAVAARLTGLVRGDDLVCRVGADEFVIARATPDPAASVEALAARIVDEFAQPFTLGTAEVSVTASIGVAVSGPTSPGADLLRDADTAMYKVKGSGRNGYAVFVAPMRDQARRRADLEQALRGALRYGELSVQYQPIMNLGTGELAGFEALMRWNHPELGMVSPLEFIPIAEDTGLIVAAGAWLLEEAAAQLARWRGDRPPDAPPLHMSVNVSVRQLRNAELVDVVRGVLHRTGLPASALWLELTESGVFDDPESSLQTLRTLRSLGLTLCIDDFGTGYSSLTYLRQFPASIVKIDRSFVSGIGEDPDDEAIVRTVIVMAHALGQQVVAEGIETPEQQRWLRDLDCDLGQGYLYSPPRPAEMHRDRIVGAPQLQG